MALSMIGNHRVACRRCREIAYYVGNSEGTLDGIKMIYWRKNTKLVLLDGKTVLLQTYLLPHVVWTPLLPYSRQ